MPGFGAVFELSSLNGTNGFTIEGEPSSAFGSSVASAGDVNGDGFDDVIIGAPGSDPDASGASYVIFGSAGDFAADFDLSSLDGINGFKIGGEAPEDYSGASVSAGDVNGDGFDDLIIGAPESDANGFYFGASYVVFGQAGGFAAEIDLASLDGTNGFQINGEAAGDDTGLSVASAGDVNGDGFDDVIIGARSADPNGYYSGASYVVFGQAGGFDAEIDLASLDGTNGFQINGEAAYDSSGYVVASAGDVNGDGIDDLLIGAPGADPNGSFSGASYVVFGQAGDFDAEIDLASLDGTNGFQINGEDDYSTGQRAASAGDVNGDGFDDLIIAAPRASPHGLYSGASYVVFGQAEGFPAEVDLSSLDGTNGFKISGETTYDYVSRVASAGDVNGDGFGDLIIGAPFAGPNGSYSGAVYVLFGQAGGFAANIDLSSLDGTNGFQIIGEYDSYSGASVASAGDIDGDGFDDLIIGSPGGESYVVFGEATGPVDRIGTDSNDRLFGGDFVDDLDGLGGNDLLDGRGDTDSMAGGAGDDTYVVDNAGDVVTENSNEGTDTVEASITYKLGVSVNNLTLTGDDDIDAIGTGSKNTLIGNSGDNTLDGRGDADSMAGGAGDDTYVVDNAGDVVTENGNEGTDTVQASITYRLGGSVNNLTLTGVDDIDATGTGSKNTLIGNTGDNTLDGRGEADTMAGGAGDDTYVVDNAGDVVTENGNEGTDTVQSSVTYKLGASVNNLTLTGSANINGTGAGSDNVLRGNTGRNTLSGGDGDDVLKGSDGNDRLTGDDDVFVFGDNDGRDIVTDFTNGSDKIDLTTVDDVDDFGDLELTDTGPGVLIDYGNGTIQLDDVGRLSAIDASDFVFA